MYSITFHSQSVGIINLHENFGCHWKIIMTMWQKSVAGQGLSAGLKSWLLNSKFKTNVWDKIPKFFVGSPSKVALLKLSLPKKKTNPPLLEWSTYFTWGQHYQHSQKLTNLPLIPHWPTCQPVPVVYTQSPVSGGSFNSISILWLIAALKI